MTKATIIYGPPGTGKRQAAINMAFQINGNNYLHLSADDLMKPLVPENIPVKSVIIVGCPNGFDFETYFNSIIQPGGIKFILTIEEKPESPGASFDARFDLINVRDYWDDLPF